MFKTLRIVYYISIFSFILTNYIFSQTISQVELENANQTFVLTILPSELRGNDFIRIYSDNADCSIKPVKVIKNNRPLWFKMITGEFSNEIIAGRIEIQNVENAIILNSAQLGNDNVPVQLVCIVSGKVVDDFELKIAGMEDPKNSTSTSIKSIKIIIKNKIQE